MRKSQSSLGIGIVLAFFVCFGLVRLSQISTTNPLSIILFAIFTLAFSKFFGWHRYHSANRYTKIPALALGILLSIFTVAGARADIQGTLSSHLFIMVVFLCSFMGFTILYYIAVLSFIIGTKRLVINTTSKVSSSSKLAKFLPYICFFSCMIFWLPWFLINYPGVMTIDSINQFGQAIGAIAPSNHHPYFHTLVIKGFVLLGNTLFKSVTIGIALYTIFQMFSMAFIFSYFVKTCCQLRVKMKYIFCTIAFFALIPYNGIMSVTMWKDVLFSGCMLLFSTCILRFMADRLHMMVDFGYTSRVLFVISAVGISLFRANGFYIFLAILPVLLFAFRKNIIYIFIPCVFSLLIVCSIRYPLMNHLQVENVSFIESLSIPLQTIGRVYYEDAATPEETAKWNKFIDTEKIPDYYYPSVSDNMKALMHMGNEEYIENHKSDLLRLWISSGLKHPLLYAVGWMDATNGYWYPDIECENPIACDTGIIPNSYGLTAKPVVSGPAVIKLQELLLKLPVLFPVYGMFWSIGAFVWAMLILFTKLICGENKGLCIAFVPSILLLLTLLLAVPVACEFRYGYGFILCAPLFVISAFLDEY